MFCKDMAFANCLQGIKIPVGVVGGGIIPTASLPWSECSRVCDFNVLLVYSRVCGENSQSDKALQPQKPLKSKVSLRETEYCILDLRKWKRIIKLSQYVAWSISLNDDDDVGLNAFRCQADIILNICLLLTNVCHEKWIWVSESLTIIIYFAISH